MSAPLPVDLASFTDPCPACGAPLLLSDTKTSSCGGCGCVVGSPGRFVDDKKRRKPLRPAFATGPLRACCRCKQTVQRVLVDDVGGSFCAHCNLVFVARSAAPRLLNPVDPSRLRVQTERPKNTRLRARDWAAVALALVAIGVIAAVEMKLI